MVRFTFLKGRIRIRGRDSLKYRHRHTKHLIKPAYLKGGPTESNPNQSITAYTYLHLHTDSHSHTLSLMHSHRSIKHAYLKGGPTSSLRSAPAMDSRNSLGGGSSPSSTSSWGAVVVLRLCYVRECVRVCKREGGRESVYGKERVYVYVRVCV